MKVPVLAGVLILGGVGLGWILHHRSVRRVTPILQRLAAEKDGKVESQGLFLMPKLLFTHSGTEVEISSASSGIAAQSTRYTYAVFGGLDSRGFEFRIQPRSLQTIGDKWVGRKKPVFTRAGKLDARLVIYTNDEQWMEAVLSDRIQADLLAWAEQKSENRINDVRNYEDKLIYAVTGTLDSYEEYRILLDTACRFYDAVTDVVSKWSKAPTDM